MNRLLLKSDILAYCPSLEGAIHRPTIAYMRVRHTYFHWVGLQLLRKSVSF